MAKTKAEAFVRLMMLLLAFLKADVLFRRSAHSAGATDTRPRRSHFHTEAETEQKAIPTVCARSSPAVDSGSACARQESGGKAWAARAPSAAAPVAL